MKNNSKNTAARALLVVPFLIVSLCLFVLAFSNLLAGNPGRSSDIPTSPNLVPTNFMGTFDPHAYPCATPRHHFMVPAGQARIVVHVDAEVATNDLSVTLLYGPDPNPTFIQPEDTGVGNEVLNYSPGAVPPGEYQVQVCLSANPVSSNPPYDYVGVFAYDDTGAGTPPPPTGTLVPAPQDVGAKIGYENFDPPGVLTPVIVTSSGGATGNLRIAYFSQYLMCKANSCKLLL